jgi:hypothetical protein
MIIHSERITPAQLDKVKKVSADLKIDPNWLLMAMFKETGGTFSPSIKNPTSSATGLIQFMESTAKSLGTSTAALRKMTFIQQMDYVYKYFLPFKGRLKSFFDVYLAIFYPAAIGKPDSWIFPNWVYVANKGLDTNKSGKITLGEWKAWALKGQGLKSSTTKKNNIKDNISGIIPLILFCGFIAGLYIYTSK